MGSWTKTAREFKVTTEGTTHSGWGWDSVMQGGGKIAAAMALWAACSEIEIKDIHTSLP